MACAKLKDVQAAFDLMEREVGYSQAHAVILRFGVAHVALLNPADYDRAVEELNIARLEQRQSYWDWKDKHKS